jgi:integrase
MDKILTEFFASARKEDGKNYAINTFHGIRHSVARSFKKKYNVDIIKDKSFTRTNQVFEAVLMDIKRSGCGVVTHYPVISDDDLSKIANWKWSTPKELQLKSWFTLHFHSILRGRENLHDLQIEDIIFTCEHGKNVARLRDKLTKNHRKDVTSANGGTIFGTNYEDCPLLLLQHYISKLCKKNPYLWQRPRVKVCETDDEWYVDQKVGINTVGYFMKTLSEALGLSQCYTNHSVRATAITVLGRAYQDNNVAHLSGHKSLTALGIYKRVSDSCKQKISDTLHSTIISSSSSSS